MTGTDKLNGSPVLPFSISRHVRVVRNLLNDATPVYAAQYIKVNIDHKDYNQNGRKEITQNTF